MTEASGATASKSLTRCILTASAGLDPNAVAKAFVVCIVKIRSGFHEKNQNNSKLSTSAYRLDGGTKPRRSHGRAGGLETRHVCIKHFARIALRGGHCNSDDGDMNTEDQYLFWFQMCHSLEGGWKWRSMGGHVWEVRVTRRMNGITQCG